MSESTNNPLNDFLEMEDNNGIFDTPFGQPAHQGFVQPPMAQPMVQPQPVAFETPVAQPPQPSAPAPQMQPTQVVQPQPVPAPNVVPMPQANGQSAQNSPFAAALAQTPAVPQPSVAAPVVQPPVQQPVAQPPVQTPAPTPAPAPVQTTEQIISNSDDPFAAALASAKAQSDGRLVESCSERDAIFSYGKAKEPITDKDCTFEELREKYEGDFPELSESKKVEWTVTYGKESKTITNPGSDKVYDIKAEIEKSKKFIDGIKKAKSDADKNPECIVKPRIKAQSKGEVIPLSSYKAFASTEQEARQSDKLIVLLPSSDGRIYQMRKTQIGTFVAPAENLTDFDTVKSGFQMNLPKIPMHILMFIWDFFAKMSDRYAFEALVHILYDTTTQKYTMRVPKQELTHTSVNSVMDEDYPEHLIHVMDIHSHNTMPAEFSPIDDDDEKPTRLYAVMGRLDKVLPDIKVRAGCAGKFISVEPADVFDVKNNSFPYPKTWDEQIVLPKPKNIPALPEGKRRFFRVGARI